MSRLSLIAVPSIALAVLAFGCGAPHHDSAVVVANETCPMSGNPVDEASFYEHEGTKIYTCCDKCVAGVEADPATAMATAYPDK